MKFAKQLKTTIDKLVGANGENLLNGKISVQDIFDKAGEFLSKIPDNLMSGKVPLSHFSNWLTDFDPTMNPLEIPGQYLKYVDRPPNVDEHELIASIDQTLLVMSSIRKPKRIIFIGTGGNQYSFLVKVTNYQILIVFTGRLLPGGGGLEERRENRKHVLSLQLCGQQELSIRRRLIHGKG